MNEYNEYLEFAKNIAKHAGKVMLKYFNQENGASYKGDKTIVTLADTEINSYLISQVKEKYPSHAVDGEEEQFGDSKYKWVCDPVDGTAMYARHIPVAVFSLALVIDGESIVGLVYDPFQDLFDEDIKGFPEDGLNFVDFQFVPHFNNEAFPKIRKQNLLNASKNLKEIDGKKLYVIDDNGAIFVNGNDIKVVSEGEWFEV